MDYYYVCGCGREWFHSKSDVQGQDIKKITVKKDETLIFKSGPPPFPINVKLFASRKTAKLAHASLKQGSFSLR